MEHTSFSYRKFFGGDTLMVVVPHEDDEVNLAGATIYGARQEGMRVLCVFVTNGDSTFPGSLRIAEAVHSLSVLGVSEEDVIFLGYPDGGAHGERSVLVHGRNEAVQAGMHRETYGCEGHEDFSFTERGYHQLYQWENLLADLQAVILKYCPDGLIGTDFDSHADHRMVSLAFDKVIGMVLNRVKDYRPVVVKGFCYATSYDSVKDFYGKHLLSTVIRHNPLWKDGQTTDNPCYDWNRRLRFPVVKDCQNLLMKNPLFYALMAHVSQKGHRRAKQVINGDQVFWLRRTDNLLYNGRVTASSGNAGALHDFMLLDTVDIDAKVPRLSNSYLWQPDASDMEKWCRVDFTVPRHIEAASLYGNVEEDSQIRKAQLTFSNGFSMEIRNIKKLGQETEISFPPQDDVQWVKITILEADGPHAGLSEWEIYEKEFSCSPFLKICINGQFAYDWTVYPGEKMNTGIYRWGTNDTVEWFVNGKHLPLERLQAYATWMSGRVVIRAELAKHPGVYDEIILRRDHIGGLFWREMQLDRDHIGFLLKNNHQRKLYHQLRRDIQQAK